MKPKVLINKADTLPLGCHLVFIKEFDLEKNDKGNIVLDQQGIPKGLRVVFQEVNGTRQRVKKFPFTPKMLWLQEALGKAIGVDITSGKQYNVRTEILNKKLYITVVMVRNCINNEPIREPLNGGGFSYQQYTEVGKHFFAYNELAPAPVPLGNPDPSNPTEWYLVLRNIEK